MAQKLNKQGKALKSYLAKAKKFDKIALFNYELAFQTNGERGKTYDQHEINEMYSRHVDFNNECGATKVTHLEEYVVVKRAKMHASKGLGNQLIDEIEAYKKLYGTQDEDLICPILKWFTSKSDKVSKNSETMFNNVVIIAQKAVYVSNARNCCQEAEYLNKVNGFIGEDGASRYAKLKILSDRQGWWDAMNNGGNSGVIFDYSTNCYKAVFIDYAL